MVLVAGSFGGDQMGCGHVRGKCLYIGSHEKAMWILLIVLAVYLPRKVDVKGWGVLLGGVSSLKWVVDAVKYGLHGRDGTGVMGTVLNRDQTVPCQLVWVVTPV